MNTDDINAALGEVSWNVANLRAFLQIIHVAYIKTPGLADRVTELPDATYLTDIAVKLISQIEDELDKTRGLLK